eukprot:GDKH01008001.1.p1 GENE.GDKH01008001.1~~GDKH01008001.1.p1  ORF type:complete len:106 (-),score=2.86 GDKH01008001.1:159-476(-)
MLHVPFQSEAAGHQSRSTPRTAMATPVPSGQPVYWRLVGQRPRDRSTPNGDCPAQSRGLNLICPTYIPLPDEVGAVREHHTPRLVRGGADSVNREFDGGLAMVPG